MKAFCKIMGCSCWKYIPGSQYLTHIWQDLQKIFFSRNKDHLSCKHYLLGEHKHLFHLAFMPWSREGHIYLPLTVLISVHRYVTLCSTVLVSTAPPTVFDAGMWKQNSNSGHCCSIMSPWMTYFELITLLYCLCFCNSSYSFWCRDLKLATQLRHAWYMCIKQGHLAQSDSGVRGHGFDTRSSHILSFLLPLIPEGQLSVTGESMCMKYWLIA